LIFLGAQLNVKFEWDEDKRAANLKKHGVDFAIVDAFEWEDAVVLPDDRYDYGEPRYMAFGRIADRLHCVWFTKRSRTYRIIGIRKANRKEVRIHG
jgi:uncharacterized DUF497 family protein